MINNSVSIDILGSCVSRVILLGGDVKKKGSINNDIKIRYFLDKNHIVCSMLPPPFSRDEVDSIQAYELWDFNRIRVLKQALNKDTIPMLLSGESDFLIIDLYDFMTDVACFEKTMFSTVSNEFFNTNLYKEKYIGKISNINFMNLQPCLWYGYVDLFFEKILSKYDSNHILINKIKASSHYISKDGYINLIPSQYLKSFHANFKYNKLLNELEEYIVKKYNIRVLDFSKYFIVDENLWENLNGVHYQKLFYTESLTALKDILLNKSNKLIYDKLSCKCVSDILLLNLANDDEYLKYFKQIESPFNSCDLLDLICCNLTEAEIIKNRKFIGTLYLAAHRNQDMISDCNISNEIKINRLIETISKCYTENDFTKCFIEFISNFYKEDIIEAVKYMNKIFLELLNNEDYRWIKLLEKMEELLPNDRTILFYCLQYFEAINDDLNIEKYKIKLQNSLEIL